MSICPNCGSWVDEGDICMSCGGSGGGSSNDNYCGSGSYGGYGGRRSTIDWEESKKRNLESKKRMYESKLEEARQQKDPKYRIKYYGEALKYAKEYWRDSERNGITIEGMPDINNIFSNEDVDWISKKHYDECYKLHILSIDQTENLENLLRESGNGDRISSNEATRRRIKKENARRWAIERTKRLRESYFKHIAKANESVLEDKPKRAIKEYRMAIRDYEEYFETDYTKDGKRSEMPEKSLTDEALDHIVILYVITHPRLTSRKSRKKVNEQIVEMLDGEWDQRLRDGDMEVDRIIEQRNLEWQRKKEKVEEVAVDVIVGARIAGDKILKRFKK